MYSSRCNCNNGNNSCNRNGERILVNQGGNCNSQRRRCACQDTCRPCRDDRQRCGCNERESCRPRPCPPRPCPPRPRPSCEDRCRAQYRQCMRNCRMREDEDRDACEFDYDDFDMNE